MSQDHDKTQAPEPWDHGATWTAEHSWQAYPPADVLAACETHDAPAPDGRVWVFMVSPDGGGPWLVCEVKPGALLESLGYDGEEEHWMIEEDHWVAKVGHADPAWLESLGEFEGF